MVPGRSIFLLVATFALLCQDAATAVTCTGDTIKCKDGSQCINHNYVCRSGDQCSDGSDEEPNICEFWKYSDHGTCGSRGQFSWKINSCYTANAICQRSDLSKDLDRRICDLVRSGTLNYQPGLNLTDGLMADLTTAVTTTIRNQTKACPMLYSRVGPLCLAFFSPAKVSWAEARQFCRSIRGDLLRFTNSRIYGIILDYMQKVMLTSSYWIGGRFDMDTNAWSWAHNDSPMPLGSPYWAQKYSSSCVPRSLPHTDPFSPPTDPLSGSPCYHYLQAPIQRKYGWCSVMTYENFYYVSDEECDTTTYSPLCLLTNSA